MTSLYAGGAPRRRELSGADLLRDAGLFGAGGVLFIASLVLALVLATHDAADPSWNYATGRAPSNILGQTGAILADLLIQTFGLGAGLLPVVLGVWATRLLLRQPLRRPLLRLLALPLLPALAAVGLGLAAPRLGGAVAFLVWHQHWAAASSPAPAIAAASLFGFLLAFELGLTAASWGSVRSYAAEAIERRRGIDLMAVFRRLAPAGAPRGSAPERAARPEPGLNRSPGPRPPLDGAAPVGPAAPVASVRRTIPRDIVAPPRAAPARGRREEEQRQTRLDLDPEPAYELPPPQLLADAPADRQAGPSDESLQRNAHMLLDVLEDFGVHGQIVKVRPGPVVTLYELEPAPGTKSARVIGLADDIARSMSAVSVRVAVVPGRNVIGIELPNARAETVYLRELLGSEAYERASGKLPLVLGKDIGGGPIIADLAKMPHLLIAGTTGSGKSVGINTMILSILYRMAPDACKFIMIDPKMLELSVYDGIPHLLAPVVTDPKKAVVALKWTVREMENRYRSMSKLGVRNIEGYNQKVAEALGRGETLSRRVQTGFDPESGDPLFEEQPLDSVPLPFIVVVVDEMADLMLVAGKDIEAAIQRLAQMARAAGIHIIMATQRPSVDVITGTIKANFPTRISFQVTSKIDSRTILGESGAEQLLGKGDMLHMAGGGRIVRVHGPFVSDHEVEAVVQFLKRQGQPDYVDAVTEGEDDEGETAGAVTEGGELETGAGADLYDQAVAIVTREKRASISFVQRQLQIGYNRAARLIERMEKEGVVSTQDRNGKRAVIAPPPPH